MKRLVVDALPPVGGRVRLSAEQSRYLVRVRRMAVGSEVACTDGDGTAATARIVAVEGERSAAVTVEVVAVDSSSPETVGEVHARGPRSTLYTALLKGRQSDRAVRQATELGIDRIVPLLTEHCVSRPGPDDLRRKKGRWDQIAREATQQSGRTHVPEIAVGESFAHLLSPRGARTLSLAFYEKASAIFGPAALPARPKIESIEALVGPEGGLSPGEVEALSAAGWTLVRIPVPTLRAETAVVAASTLVQHLRSEYTARCLGDLSL